MVDRREFCLGLGGLSGALMIPAALHGAKLQNQMDPTPGARQASMDEKIMSPKQDRMKWWRGARFGMMIHWGVYSIPARGEWVQWHEQIPVREYAKLADQFNPAHFDPDQWAALAKDAGMRYTVLTARHHDGYALFHDPGNPFTSMSTAARRDLVGEYVRAVRKAGLHVGLYYSPLDWRFPGFFFPNLQMENAEQLRAQYHRQIRELMSNYGEIDMLWFDGGESDWLSFRHDMSNADFPKLKPGQHYHGQFSWEGEKVNAMLRTIQPQIIVNNRAAGIPPDYQVREWFVGNFDNTTPWETAYPLAGYWGYAGDTEPMSLKDTIHLLANVVGRDGNLLLNIGPRADGTIVPSHVQRLREIGEWTGKYGESIYGTRGGPFMPAGYGVSTHRGNRIYVHLIDASISKITLPPIPARVMKASCLTGEPINFTQDPAALNLTLTRNNRNEINVVIALELDKAANEIDTIPVS